MAVLRTGDEAAPNRVEFLRKGSKRWLVSTFDDPGEAYRFWLYLRKGTYAILYQNGEQRGAGA